MPMATNEEADGMKIKGACTAANTMGRNTPNHLSLHNPTIWRTPYRI
jgi:hypothetical protein